MTTITPTYDQIIIEKDDPEEKSSGGIHIPENRRKQQATATVVAVGPGRVTESGTVAPPCVKPGDKIVIRAIAGITYVLGSESFIFIRDDEIVGIINE